MIRYVRHTIAALMAALLFYSPIISVSALTQDQQESKEEKKLREQQEKRAKQEEERKDKEAKARVKETKKYNTLSEFAEDLYATDIEFRNDVDKDYLDLQGSMRCKHIKLMSTEHQS